MSLRDQLLQAGLISEKQIKQNNKQQHQQRREQGKKPPQPDPAQLAARRAAEEKRARDQDANRKRQEAAAQKAIRAEIKQLVDQHKLPRIDSEMLFNFVDGQKIRRIPVDAQRRDQLSAGQLAIVRSDGRYEVVPAAIGERVRERDARSVMTIGGSSASTPDDNDPYKDYVVPDDLMW